MSEADSPNDQSGSPAPAEPIKSTTALDSNAPSAGSSEDWQTVDFPGAMSIDALLLSATDTVEQSFAGSGADAPSSGVIHYSNADIVQTDVAQRMTSFSVSAKALDDATLRQQLQDENVVLRDRLAQVELDLVQQQIEWQLALANTQTQAEAVVAEAEQPFPLELTNDRLDQLLQELERSRQTTQRQQILVETLTEQLESSQERIAQLERDCALTQQRHNEQVQQVLQAEGACRDLRLRLHRQQQQTLQFKAALEKCLEMPTAYGQPLVPDVAIADSAETTDTLAALLQLKHQPVKPWSLPRRATDEVDSDLTELPKPLFKLLSEPSAQGHGVKDDTLTTELHTQFSGESQNDALSAPVDPSALLDSDDPQFVTQLMQLIFPKGAEQQVYTTADALQEEPAFDVDFSLNAEKAHADFTLTDEGASLREIALAEPAADRVAVHFDAIARSEQKDNATTLSADAIANAAPVTQTDDRANNPLWNHLIALSNSPENEGAPTTAIETNELPGASSSSTDSVHDSSLTDDSLVAPMGNHFVQAAPHSVGIPPFFTTSTAKLTPLAKTTEPDRAADPKNSTDSSTTRPIAAWTWRDRLKTASQAPRITEPEKASPEEVAPNPAKDLALISVGQQPLVSQPAESVASDSNPKPTPFSAVIPSPIVYPLRSTKKLASLAAVDLPTFPKR